MLTSKRDYLLRIHHLEGTLSDMWQDYCRFVRFLLIKSATGCRTANAVAHSSSISPANWERASYIAINACRKKPISLSGTNNVLRKEPTWGDPNKISDIVTALNPGNKTTLISHLSGGLPGPKHCQIVRNACAHKNHQTKSEVLTLAPNYIATQLIKPIDAITWIDPASNQYAFLSWIEDMKIIAEGAVG